MKRIVIKQDNDFNLTDASLLSNNARGKSLQQITHTIDSIDLKYDSIGKASYKEMRYVYMPLTNIKQQKIKDFKAKKGDDKTNFDVLESYNKLTNAEKQQALATAQNTVARQISELEYRSMITQDGDTLIRFHKIEAYNKFTTAFSCLLFFFIGASLGAIIRKGGLGIPIIVSVLVFITYYILDNSGYRMAREGIWSVWFGKLLSTLILTPLAVFVTYKAHNDSMVFNLDLYRNFFIKLFGLHLKRHISMKEVVIYEPHYSEDREKLSNIQSLLTNYRERKKLQHFPNPLKVFFQYNVDHEIEDICEQLEKVIEDLANTKDAQLISMLNKLPILSTKAHTRPFEKKWLNTLCAIIVPLGFVLYVRMWHFRLRLWKDSKSIINAIDNINEQIIFIQETNAQKSIQR